jgi:dTDP-4-amino-4,6-dideoxygalactose transaminase
MINYGKQFIDTFDIAEVKKSLHGNLITTGKYVNKFENKIKKFLSCNFALSCNSGTAALSLAFQSLNIKKQDNIILPVVNFIAAYSMASNTGANIYFADVCPKTGQMTPKTLLDCIKKNNLNKIRLFLTMYLGGSPENIKDFYKIKRKYKCAWIEDACHALGARFNIKNKNYYVGCGMFADISIFSLHPLKTITSGEGGIVTTNSKKIYKTILELRSHGIIRSKKNHTKYDIKKLSFNYRLSDINCALAYSQLKKINKFLLKRQEIATFYKKNLYKLNRYIELPKYSKDSYSAWHFFIINLNFLNKNNLISYLKANKIIVQYHYIPIYEFSFFKKKFQKNQKNKFSNSQEYYKKSISLPIYYSLTKKNQIKIIKTITNFIKINEK